MDIMPFRLEPFHSVFLMALRIRMDSGGMPAETIPPHPASLITGLLRPCDGCTPSGLCGI